MRKQRHRGAEFLLDAGVPVETRDGKSGVMALEQRDR